MNQKDNEKLVLLIASGQNTYKDLRHEFPGLPASSWLRLDVAHASPIITAERQLKDSTVFILNRAGEDLLYALQKEGAIARREVIIEARERKILFYTRLATALSALGLLLSLVQYLQL